jgi:SAM-dependent methyltransferase
MNDFEKQYYESASFWEGEMLQDEANKSRINYTAGLVPEDVKSLVDVGCGNGVFVNYLHKQRPVVDILGVDRSATALRYVDTNKEEGDIASLHFSNLSFDCVTCLEVIEHLPVSVYDQALANLARIAGKYLIVSVPFNEKLEESYNQCPSCKSVFNHELHLRSFSEEYFTHLFDDYGFSCLKTQKLGASLKFRGYYFFRKFFYKEQFREWKSPICPICGYEKSGDQSNDGSNSQPKAKARHRKWISYITGLPKLIWPKETTYYWIIGLYKRNTISSNQEHSASERQSNVPASESTKGVYYNDH